MQDTTQRLSALMEKQISKKIENLSASTTLEETGVDSFDFIELMFLIEDEFDIEIKESANELGNRLKTVGDLVAFVHELSTKTPARATLNVAGSAA